MQTLKDWIAAALLAATLCAGTIVANDAKAQTAMPAIDAQLIAAWAQLDDACKGSPSLPNGRDNPACARRDRYTDKLSAKGWQMSRGGVWYSAKQREDVALIAVAIGRLEYGHTMRQLEDAAASVMLTSNIEPAQFVAIWRDNRTVIRAATPFGWAILSEVAERLARQFPNDPRFMLDE